MPARGRKKPVCLVMGADYQYIALQNNNGQLNVIVSRCQNAEKETPEEILFSAAFLGEEIYLRVSVVKGALCNFSFSTDGVDFTPAGPEFTAKPGKWIGAKVGLFALRDGTINDAGTVDIDWFRIE